jgi:hypothetical protein
LPATRLGTPAALTGGTSRVRTMLAVILAWTFAVLAAAVVLGFCAYELHWKVGRLHSDAAQLQRTIGELNALQGRLGGVRERVAAHVADVGD